MALVTNRQIGDFVIYSEEVNVAPFYIRRAGFYGAEPVSGPHDNVTNAVIKANQMRNFELKNGIGSATK